MRRIITYITLAIILFSVLPTASPSFAAPNDAPIRLKATTFRPGLGEKPDIPPGLTSAEPGRGQANNGSGHSDQRVGSGRCPVGDAHTQIGDAPFCAVRCGEGCLDEWCVRLEVGGHGDDVARFERRVTGEDVEDGVA